MSPRLRHCRSSYCRGSKAWSRQSEFSSPLRWSNQAISSCCRLSSRSPPCCQKATSFRRSDSSCPSTWWSASLTLKPLTCHQLSCRRSFLHLACPAHVEAPPLLTQRQGLLSRLPLPPPVHSSAPQYYL